MTKWICSACDKLAACELDDYEVGPFVPTTCPFDPTKVPKWKYHSGPRVICIPDKHLNLKQLGGVR